MVRLSALLIGGVLAGATPLVAQAHGASHPAAPATAQAGDSLIGSWSGTTRTAMGTGGALLVITKRTPWEVTFDLELNHPVEMGEVRDFKVDGKLVTWTQRIMASTCRAELEIAGMTMKGEIDCGQYSMEVSLTRGARR